MIKIFLLNKSFYFRAKPLSFDKTFLFHNQTYTSWKDLCLRFICLSFISTFQNQVHTCFIPATQLESFKKPPIGGLVQKFSKVSMPRGPRLICLQISTRPSLVTTWCTISPEDWFNASSSEGFGKSLTQLMLGWNSDL